MLYVLLLFVAMAAIVAAFGLWKAIEPTVITHWLRVHSFKQAVAAIEAKWTAVVKRRCTILVTSFKRTFYFASGMADRHYVLRH